MVNIEDCPDFETFGTDMKAARQAKRVSHRTMAEKINIDWRYFINIENDGAIPSLPVVIQFIKTCGFLMRRYFDPEIMREENELWQGVSHRLELCPEEYLPIIEGVIDSAIPVEKPKKNETEGT